MIPYFCKATELLVDINLIFLACSPDVVTAVPTVVGGSSNAYNPEINKISYSLQIKLKTNIRINNDMIDSDTFLVICIFRNRICVLLL